MSENMKEKSAIETSNAPGAIGPYSQGMRTGDLLFTSGHLPIDPTTGKMVEGSVADHAHQAIKNLRAVIEAAGGGLGDVVKTTVFLKNIGNFQV